MCSRLGPGSGAVVVGTEMVILSPEIYATSLGPVCAGSGAKLWCEVSKAEILPLGSDLLNTAKCADKDCCCRAWAMR